MTLIIRIIECVDLLHRNPENWVRYFRTVLDIWSSETKSKPTNPWSIELITQRDSEGTFCIGSGKHTQKQQLIARLRFRARLLGLFENWSPKSSGWKGFRGSVVSSVAHPSPRATNNPTQPTSFAHYPLDTEIEKFTTKSVWQSSRSGSSLETGTRINE